MSAPVTDNHPSEPVTVANRASYDRGHVGENIVRDGSKVAATLYVKDGRLITSIERGDQREVSCGYTCDVEMTPGVVPNGEPDAGERYDAVQRAIIYNHVAAVPKGRAGSTVRMHLDAVGNVVLDADVWSTKQVDELPDSAFLYIALGGQKDSSGKTEPRSLRHFPVRGSDGKIDLPHLRDATSRIPQSNLPATVRERVAVEAHRLLEGAENHVAQRGDAQRQENRMDAKQVRIERLDGVDYILDSDEHKAAVKYRADLEATRADKAKAEAAKVAADAKVAELQGKLDAASKPEKLDALVAERAALVDKARAVLGGEAKLDGKTVDEIKREVVAKAFPEQKLDGKHAAFIEGLYEAATASAERSDALEGLARVRVDSKPTREREDAVSAYARAIEETDLAGKTMWTPKESA